MPTGYDDPGEAAVVPSPFPGMDPYLEHFDLWPDVHNSLIAAVANELSPILRPRYYIALEERTYLSQVVLRKIHADPPVVVTSGGPAVVEIVLPMAEPVRETYLEVRSVPAGEVVTVIEFLSHANKRPGTGRALYLEKREAVLSARTNLVEVDLLRGGAPMPTLGPLVVSDYAVLVSRPHRRPKADLVAFGVRDPIPTFPLPLRKGEEEPMVDLGRVLHALYDRASYDLRIDYRRETVPPLSPADTEWASGLQLRH